MLNSCLAPVDIAFLVYFRLAFGAIVLYDVWDYWSHGWIRLYWMEPGFHFGYPALTWLQPWPGLGMYVHFFVLAVLACLILAGFCYRIVSVLTFLALAYVFLLEQAHYLNHFYLLCLVAFSMMFLPANGAFSRDAQRNRSLRRFWVPAWTLWLLRFQIGAVYFFGGIAKFNSDWLQGEPMRMWLAKRTDFFLLGPFFKEELMVGLFSYGGLGFDLLITPFLLWRKTRNPALCIAILFHVTNAWLFKIGIFPWFMILATLLFLEPDWPRRLLNRLHRGKRRKVREGEAPPPVSRAPSRPVLVLLTVFVALQLLLPLRHWVYPGNVNWTEEGHIFSWRMKLRSKKAVKPIQFVVTDPESGRSWFAEPSRYLTFWQVHKMSTRPALILNFAHYLKDRLVEEGYKGVEIRAKTWVSLNGREPQFLIDPEINLVEKEVRLLADDWILPLKHPLKPGNPD